MFVKKIFLGIFTCLLSFAACAADNADKTVLTKPIKGTVALTFDDGPNPVDTPKILEILKKYNVKATFFMVGNNVKRYPEIVKQVLAEGHAIGSHSLSHPMLTKLNDKELHKEVYTPSEYIFNVINKKPSCLRYPHGASNTHVRDVIRQAGMIPTPMGFNSFDYTNPGSDKIVSWLVKNLYSGQIILLHDGFIKRQQTVDALPQIIEAVKKKGLGFSQICKEKS